MATAATLFAHIIPRLTDRSEDIAVDALGYILSQSTAARRALAAMVAAGGAEITPIAEVRTQVAGADGATPDLGCIDEQGMESVLIEAKFWAGLTDNQPNAYLARLPKDRPSALLFVAPAQRLETLWPEILRRAQAEYQLDSTRETGNLRSVSLAGSQRRLMLASWRALLDRMAASAGDANETNAVADTRQLRGLAERMDADAFLPLRSAELGPEIPRRMRNLRNLVDDAAHRAFDQGWANAQGQGLAVTSQVYGYGRYISLNGVVVWFGINVDSWASDGQTPLWLRHTPSGEWYPITLPTGVEYTNVRDAVVSQLYDLGQELNPGYRGQ